MFIDELRIYVESGKGGNGCVSFRREKYVPRGGPDGGDGGPGGNVRVQVVSEYNTLMPLRNTRHYHAEHGKKGRGGNMTGATGSDLVLKVPRGTLVRDAETGTLLANLTQVGEETIIAKGGKGGKGNAHFTTSTHRAPKFAQEGEAGEGLWVIFELKMMADVGLVGFPNAGKSTLVRQVSSANPKVADYPFTTLKPSLGVVPVGEFQHFVMADIPGIIEGAHEGAGLGHQFLKHIERTRVLLILIDPTDPVQGVEQTFETIEKELEAFSDVLRTKKKVVAITKSDLQPFDPEANARLEAQLKQMDIPCFVISSFDLDALSKMVYALFEMIQNQEIPDEEPGPEEEPEQAGIDPLDEI